MNKIVVSVLGYDRPGIVATVARILFEHRCNIEDVSQTILQTEFAGTFLAAVPADLSEPELLEDFREELTPLGLSVLIKPLEQRGEWTPPESEPFVVTTVGPDRMGLVAGMTEVIFRYGVNIANLKAVFRGGENPRDNLMIYEVDVPVGIDQQAFRRSLRERAEQLGLDLSVQHRDIFEAIHRV
jgi:glycine cleavage system transcriptional repressor